MLAYTRMYVEAVINHDKVEFLLDTGSDITLLSEKVWEQMGATSLEKTNVMVKNASGNLMKIYGRLRWEYEMKGLKRKEWIQSNEEIGYHMSMMVAEVKAKDSSVEKELMETYPTVFEKGLGLCAKEKAELILEQGVRPVFRGYRPMTHAAIDSVDKSSIDSWKWVRTERDPVLKKVKACVRTGRRVKGVSKLTSFFNRRDTLSVVGNCIMTGERIVIPRQLQANVLKELHVAHPWIVRMKKLARCYVYCPNID
ncbi:unnamed protein product [Nippostrongylus brasiliensis]|uniref:Peptidase A2 domain-containing protein n=1 Tax=Nippostrongylus brasiliensis TaxID=27835 RepID=A0A158R1W1_NIPBR|nr:unnamed protein product [Nippostrongylus brasiliensis]